MVCYGFYPRYSFWGSGSRNFEIHDLLVPFKHGRSRFWENDAGQNGLIFHYSFMAILGITLAVGFTLAMNSGNERFGDDYLPIFSESKRSVRMP